MEERLSAAQGEILAHVRAGVATVTLNRPRALNALSFAMLHALSEWLEAWREDTRVRTIVFRGAGTRAFCAGGDVREVLESHRNGGRPGDRFFPFEYDLDLRIHRYPKPVVALLDGIVMGGGMGISQGAALRIVGDRTRMAMPETGIGLFPDVGGSYFLSRCPGRIGMYLALTGTILNAADALHAGLADLYAGAHAEPPPGELERLRPAIDRHFAAPGVEATLASLDRETAPDFAEWARATSALLRQRSPTMLKVTWEQITRGATLDLADCFRMELTIVRRCLEHGDFAEGIRAMLVDKDRKPQWNPASLADVTPATVDSFFGDPGKP
jgi:enoyl-CoA hydratase/carnithine racemase